MTPASTRFDPALVGIATHHLAAFAAANADVQLAVLTSGDGFEVASFPVQRATTAKVAAMSSSMQALSEALAREAGLSNSRSLIIETDTGTVLVLGLAGTTPRLSLAVVAANGELLGKLLWASRNLCRTLEQSLRK
jgi:predicted regulator of Ras-like GTPase activity (Roadblock/LC7/MglB family)